MPATELLSAAAPLHSDQSLQLQCLLFWGGKYIQHIHYLYPLEPAHAEELL